MAWIVTRVVFAAALHPSDHALAIDEEAHRGPAPLRVGVEPIPIERLPVTVEGDRLSIDRMPTLDGKNLSRGGQIIVDQLALVMRGHDDVTRWLIAIAMPAATEAQRVGDAVRARLLAKGVAADRFEIITAAGSAKIGGLVRQRAAADAPFVCPAGQEVHPRPEASQPAAPTAGSPAAAAVPATQPGPSTAPAPAKPPASVPAKPKPKR